MPLERHKELDVIRGIAIILVLLGHSIIVYPVNLRDVDWCRWLHSYIYSFHMHAFFFISGMLYKSVELGEYKQYIFKKFNRLIVPYLIGNILVIAAKIPFGSMVNKAHNDWVEALDSVLFHGGNLWFLYVLFFISCIFPFIAKCYEKRNTVGVCTLILIMLIVINVLMPNIEFLRLSLIAYYAWFFFLGYMLHIHKSYIESFLSSPYLVLPCLLLFASTGWMDIDLHLGLLGLFYPLVPIVCLFWFARRFPFDSLASVGKHSLAIYVMGAFMLGIARFMVINVLGAKSALFILVSIFTFKLIACSLLAITVIPRFAITRMAFGNAR